MNDYDYVSKEKIIEYLELQATVDKEINIKDLVKDIEDGEFSIW